MAFRFLAEPSRKINALRKEQKKIQDAFLICRHVSGREARA
jgi:hypothetical protein